jgi:hypothetical protein
MKKIFQILLFITTASSVFLSCSKDVTGRTDDAPALAPAKTDIDAGIWTTVLLTAPNEVAVAAPPATNTPDFTAQINEIKSWQNKLTGEEKDMVKYWSAGGVLRWNEIMRELVSITCRHIKILMVLILRLMLIIH